MFFILVVGDEALNRHVDMFFCFIYFFLNIGDGTFGSPLVAIFFEFEFYTWRWGSNRRVVSMFCINKTQNCCVLYISETKEIEEVSDLLILLCGLFFIFT